MFLRAFFFIYTYIHVYKTRAWGKAVVKTPQKAAVCQTAALTVSICGFGYFHLVLIVTKVVVVVVCVCVCEREWCFIVGLWAINE